MTSFVRRLVTNTLATCVIAAVMWMLKIVIFKELDCRFHDKDFFRNIKDFISNEYVLQTLLGSSVGSQDPNDNTLRAQLKHVKRAFEFMLLFVCTKLRTICDEVENTSPEHVHKVEDNISLVFKNLANKEHSYVQETDLLSRMKKEDVAEFLRLFDGAEETRRISQESLRNWMIKVCNERRHLVQLLNRSSKVIEQLNIHALVIQSILVTLIWCLLMGVGTTKSLAYLSPPLLLFGYYCKIIFDGAMLAIVMHPFHKGDHCIIDDDKLVVKEIGLIKTEFRKENGTNLELLNSVLLTKSVSNFNRSSELTETFEILASSSISCHQISALKLKIDELIGSNPENWRAKCSFDFRGVEEGKDAYNLEITNVRKFENYKVKEEQRYEFVLKLKMILEDMEIMCWTIK
ncbi:hypothetical protein POM88_028271 [Heracleum sosnowskyi]|uniref:Mechanosensitive ion channel MscS domain-containing protein n=1 Tax=Heracleum sosnowskyi TaxID=360622 RepID=A0AAD8MQP0_9APIA|nr:hypothetical protein POM88_028271 [Heracleum sosnowskyi]